MSATRGEEVEQAPKANLLAFALTHHPHLHPHRPTSMPAAAPKPIKIKSATYGVLEDETKYVDPIHPISSKPASTLQFVPFHSNPLIHTTPRHHNHDIKVRGCDRPSHRPPSQPSPHPQHPRRVGRRLWRPGPCPWPTQRYVKRMPLLLLLHAPPTHPPTHPPFSHTIRAQGTIWDGRRTRGDGEEGGGRCCLDHWRRPSSYPCPIAQAAGGGHACVLCAESNAFRAAH